MSELSPAPVKTYSIGFENSPSHDELEHARKVARRFGTHHIEKSVSPGDIQRFLPTIAAHFDEPMADTTAIPIYFLSQLASENGTKVVLTGDGPDELLLGYSNWKKYIRYNRAYAAYSSMPGFVKAAVAALAGYSSNSPVSEILERARYNQELFWGGARSFKESNKRRFLSSNFRLATQALQSHNVILGYKDRFEAARQGTPGSDYGDWMSYLGFRFLHPNRYLYRADRLGMAHSVETRMPFLDYHFINTALSVPTSFKLRNGEAKYILKKALEPLLGPEIVYRKKQGFVVPLRDWGRSMMTEYVSDHAAVFCSTWDVFDQRGIQFHLNEIRKGNKNYMNNLWTIYFLMAWFEKWMK